MATTFEDYRKLVLSTIDSLYQADPLWTGTKTTWEGAPKNAKFRAKDEDGMIFWFEEKPTPMLSEGFWVSNGNPPVFAARGEPSDVWFCSLEVRPEVLEVESV